MRQEVRPDPGGERLLTVARVVEASYSDGASLLESVRAALEPVLPFFERHIVHQSADLAPQPLHCLLKPDNESGDPIGLRPLSEAHDRLLFASSSVYPGFGLEGQILGARAAADHAVALTGRKSVSAT